MRKQRKEKMKMGETINAGKRPWRRPGLVVLERTRPEEAVLTNCKTMTTPINIKQKPRCTANACKVIGGS